MKGLLELDVYRLFGTTWILVKITFGLAVLAIGFGLARDLECEWPERRLANGFLQDLARYNLNAAHRFLTTLAEFENEPAYSPHERSNIREYSPEE